MQEVYSIITFSESQRFYKLFKSNKHYHTYMKLLKRSVKYHQPVRIIRSSEYSDTILSVYNYQPQK
jgi:hypothetical protein